MRVRYIFVSLMAKGKKYEESVIFSIYSKNKN